MDYQRIYNQIISRAVDENNLRLSRKDSGEYFELHHVIPKCMGGSDIQSNIAVLTAREHFLCHWLLCRIYPSNNKIVHAFWLMCSWNF